mmetsp:Transcript_20750/g.43453  ORF Transcript_20750/g.43453 Transcript_20750/m.43453 type:complete len:473 (+) Transcript_20750:441-1859(+)
MHAPPGTRGFQRPTQPFRRDRRPSNTRPRRRPSRENRAFHGATATPHRASPAGAARSHRARPGTGRTLAGLRNVVLVTASVGVPGPRNGVVSPRETNDGASHGRVGAPLSLSLRAFLGSRGGWSPSKTCVRPTTTIDEVVSVRESANARASPRPRRTERETGAAATGKKAPEPNTIPNQFEHDEAEREDTDANPRTRSTPGSQTKRLARGTLCPARDAPRRGPLAGGPDPRQQDVPGRPLDGERAPRARPCRNAATGEDPGGNGRRPHPVTSMPDNNGMVPAKEKSSRNDPSAFQRSFTVEEAGVWNECLDCKKRHRCGGHLPEVLFVDRSSPSTTALRGCRFAGRERWRRGRRIDPTRDVPFAAAGEGVVVASEESAGTTDPDGLERGRVGHGLCLRDVSTSCRGTPRRREEQRTKTHHHRNGSPVLGCGGWFVFCFGNCLEHKWQAVVGFFCELNVRPPIESESEEFSVV